MAKVVVRGCDERGFAFFTNYQSRKGAELAANPRAALVFFWEPFDRQVRIEGRVEKVSAAESDAYFHSRPRGSRLGAWASPQSQVLPGRDALDAWVNEMEAKYAGQDVFPRPPHWGGYRVVPELIEFWQGQPSRLHDRLRYQRQADGSWKIDRLSPQPGSSYSPHNTNRPPAVNPTAAAATTAPAGTRVSSATRTATAIWT